MMNDKEHLELTPDELEAQHGASLPDKEASSLISIGDVALNVGDIMLDVDAPIGIYAPIDADVGINAPIDADVGINAPISANVFAPIDVDVFAPIDANDLAWVTPQVQKQFEDLVCTDPEALDAVVDDPKKPLITCGADGTAGLAGRAQDQHGAHRALPLPLRASRRRQPSGPRPAGRSPGRGRRTAPRGAPTAAAGAGRRRRRCR